MRLVILESPYAGDTEANVMYARACMRDSLQRGECPIAAHLLYTQDGILDDTIPAERACGIAAGLAWLRVAQASVVYVDRGISPGMLDGIQAAERAGVPVEMRRILTELRPADRPGAQTVGPEIGLNDDGTLDEIIAFNAYVHLEQMDDSVWWMAIEQDGKTIHVHFWSKTKIDARSERA